jgi:hypothetical protein
MLPQAVLIPAILGYCFQDVVGGSQGKLLIITDPRTNQRFTKDLTGKTKPLEDFIDNLELR